MSYASDELQVGIVELFDDAARMGYSISFAGLSVRAARKKRSKEPDGARKLRADARRDQRLKEKRTRDAERAKRKAERDARIKANREASAVAPWPKYRCPHCRSSWPAHHCPATPVEKEVA
jgi:hypothetical protein